MKPKTLTELCEPWFLEVCGTLRSGKLRPGDGLVEVRNRLLGILQTITLEAQGLSASVSSDFLAIRGDLVYFADDVFSRSSRELSEVWRGNMLIAADPTINVADGMARFFVDLGGALAQEGSDERLKIFLTCLSLGFCGIHAGQPAELRGHSEAIVLRLARGGPSLRPSQTICPEALQVDSRRLYKPVRERILALGVVFGALLLACIVLYSGGCIQAGRSISEKLGDIKNLP